MRTLGKLKTVQQRRNEDRKYERSSQEKQRKWQRKRRIGQESQCRRSWPSQPLQNHVAPYHTHPDFWLTNWGLWRSSSVLSSAVERLSSNLTQTLLTPASAPYVGASIRSEEVGSCLHLTTCCPYIRAAVPYGRWTAVAASGLEVLGSVTHGITARLACYCRSMSARSRSSGRKAAKAQPRLLFQQTEAFQALMISTDLWTELVRPSGQRAAG